MAMLTVSTLAMRLAQEFGEAQDTEYLDNLTNWINDALDEIGVMTDWKFFQSMYSFSTVAGTRVYDFPSDLRDIRDMRLVDSDLPIDFVTVPQLVQLGVDLEQQGRPQKWYIEKANTTGASFVWQIGFWPVPEGIYEINSHYIYHPSDLLSTDKVPIPDEVLRAVKYRVKAEQKELEQDYDGADRAFQKFATLLQKLSAKNNRGTATNTRFQIRDVGTSRDRFARLDPTHFRN